MNRSDVLVLLTNYYPYYRGEEYIESEIGYLSEAFDRVIILSQMIKEGAEQTRELPANVEAYPSGVDHSMLGRLKMITSEWRESRKFMKREKPSGKYRAPRYYMYDLYFEARCRMLADANEKILRRVLREGDRIVFYSYWLYITARVAISLKQRLGLDDVDIVSRAHRYDIDLDEAPLRFLPERRYLLEHVDAVDPVASSQIRFLEESRPDLSEKYSVRHLGTIDHLKDKSLDDYMERRSGIIADRQLFRLVSCSGIRKVKRVDLIVEGLAELFERYPDTELHWTHYGAGPDFDKIRQLAEKKLPRDSFRFAGHIANRDLIKAYLADYPDFLINVSTSEGVPVSIMEASSLGIPTIATDAGGTGEVVRNGETGFLLPIELSAETLAETIREAMTLKPEQYETMSRATRALWENEFDSEKLYPDFARELKARLPE